MLAARTACAANTCFFCRLACFSNIVATFTSLFGCLNVALCFFVKTCFDTIPIRNTAVSDLKILDTRLALVDTFFCLLGKAWIMCFGMWPSVETCLVISLPNCCRRCSPFVLLDQFECLLCLSSRVSSRSLMLTTILSIISVYNEYKICM